MYVNYVVKTVKDMLIGNNEITNLFLLSARKSL